MKCKESPTGKHEFILTRSVYPSLRIAYCKHGCDTHLEFEQAQAMLNAYNKPIPSIEEIHKAHSE